MGAIKSYQSTKASNVDWIGEIPESWQIHQGKRVFRNRREQANTHDMQLAASQKYGVIPQEQMMKLNDSKVMLALKGTDSFRHVEQDDFVISLRSFEGGIEHSNFDGCVSPAYTVLNASRKLIPRYFKYLFKSQAYISALQASTDSLRDGKSISYEQFGSIPLTFPSVIEQSQIAAFLDRETAKIDQLIDKQQQLIKLLEEKRQAVISHAVTKGLNPDAQMKDSGVEWLGQVPEHWVVKRLKHISPKMGVGLVINPSTYTKDEGLHFIFGGNVIPYGFKLEGSRKISEEDSLKLHQSRLRTNDIVTVRVGAPGVTAVVDKDLSGSNCASVMITRRGNFNSHWLCACMNSPAGTEQVRRVEYGAAQKQFNISDAIDFIFPTPPKQEQDEIAQYVDNMLKKFSELQTTISKQIQLLKERRTALISAAVTGKIDVRDQVPQDDEAIAS